MAMAWLVAFHLHRGSQLARRLGEMFNFQDFEITLLRIHRG
jgi:hypothetical protein